MKTRPILIRAIWPKKLIEWFPASYTAKLVSLLFLLCALPMEADLSYLGFGYRANNGAVTVTSYYDSAHNPVTSIPATIFGLPVTSIGSHAFSSYTQLRGITIPASVTNIDSDAFYSYSTLGLYFQGDAPSASSYVFTGASNVIVYYLPGTLGWDATFHGRPTQSMLRYTTNLETITITGCNGSPPSLAIPGTINGLPVTSIGPYAFDYCTSLSGITIPASVTSIGNYAFSECYSLSRMTIPASITNIGSNAFSFCPSLTGLFFEGDAPSADASIFYGDNNVIVYYLPWKVGWDTTFYGSTAKSMLLYTANADSITITSFTGSLASFTIPSTINGLPVTSIGPYAFYNCSNLANVTIPDTVTSIGYGAFEGCISLTSAPLGGNVAYIGNAAFCHCINLTNATLGSNVTTIGDFAFAGCGGLTSLIMPSTVTSISNGAFAFCKSLTSVTIPDTVTTLGSHAFYFCAGLTNLTLPNGLTRIAKSAFASCSNLATVGIPNTVSNIDYWGFSDCTSLANVSLPNSLRNIGSYAFASCTNLTSVVIPDSVTTIGNSAFDSCSALASVSIGSSVTNIDYQAFASCSGLPSVAIPSAVSRIGEAPFYGCASLSEITVDPLSPYYTSVGGVLFDKSQRTLIQYPGGKTGSYTIPGTVTNIANSAFEFCTGLTSISIPESLTGIGDGAFASCSGFTSITIPKSVWSVGGEAFASCANLTAVSMTTRGIPGYDITSIGDSAFDSCTSLTGIFFQSNAPWLGVYVFAGDNKATVYYLPGTTGWYYYQPITPAWPATFGGLPTMLWTPQPQIINPGFGGGISSFGFTISGASNLVVVVEGCADLGNPIWFPVGTNTLTGGSAYFSDPQWTNYSGRFYRLRSP